MISLAVIWRLLPTVKRPDVSHSLDYLGAAVFSLAIGTLLVGLTNKRSNELKGRIRHFWFILVSSGLVYLVIGIACFILAKLVDVAPAPSPRTP